MVAKKISAFSFLESLYAEADSYMELDNWNTGHIDAILTSYGIPHAREQVELLSLMGQELHYAEYARNSPGKRSEHMREYRRVRKLLRESFKGITVPSPEPSVGD